MYGSLVTRWSTRQHSAGDSYSVVTQPYYRDDSCFDDGTGTDPKPRIKLRSSTEPRTWTDSAGVTRPRECWSPSDGLPDGSQRYFQGDIGTHGLHLLFQLDSDNARFDSDNRH